MRCRENFPMLCWMSPTFCSMLSDVTSCEAQDTPTVSGHLMGMTRKLFDWDGWVGKWLLWRLRGWERKCHVPVENLGQSSISETCEDKKQYFPGCPGPAETSGDQSLTGCVACIWDPSYSHHWAWQIAGTELWAAVHGDSQMSTQCLASLRRFQSHPPD